MSSGLSEETLAAAAGVAEDLMTQPDEEAPKTPTLSLEQQRALAVQRAEEARGPQMAENEAPEPPEPDPEDAAPEAEAEPEIPQAAPAEWFEPDEQDFEAEARAELAAETEPEQVEAFQYEDDPRLLEERTKRIALEKKVAHVEAQRVKDARKSWVAEAKEHAPLATHLLGENLENIDATSKRAFLREAGQAHDAMRSALGQVIGPAKEVIADETTRARQEAKDAAAEAYGRPTTGPGASPAEAAEARAKITAARERKGLQGAIRAMLDTGMNP